MRVALYARYSSDRQNERSIDDQLDVCRRHAEARGWAVTATFQDAAISGAAMANRPGLQGLLALAEARVVDAVLVEDEDRLARNQEHAHHIKSRLDYAGVSIATLITDHVDDIGLTFKGLMGAMFLKNLAAKTKRGMHSNFEKGLATGSRLYGYRTAPGGAVEIVAEEKAVIERIFHGYANGLTARDIANLLNEDAIPSPRGGAWSHSTIQGNPKRGNGILRTDLYAGVKQFNRVEMRRDPRTGKRHEIIKPRDEWRSVDVPHLRIVEPDLWGKVAARLATTAKIQPALQVRRKVGVFGGLFKCGVCGSAYSATNYGQLACYGRRNKGDAYCSNQRTVRRAKIEAYVLETLQRRLLSPEAVRAYVRAYHIAWNEQRARETQAEAPLRARLAEVGRRSARLLEAIETGATTAAILDRLAALEAERGELEIKLQAMAADELPLQLHPGAAEAYARKVADLQGRLAASAQGLLGVDRTEDDQRLVDFARDLVEKIEIIPLDDGRKAPIEIVLYGKLALLLTPDATKRPQRGALVAGGGCQRAPLSHVIPLRGRLAA